MIALEERLLRLESDIENLKKEIEEIQKGNFGSINLSDGINLIDSLGNLKFTMRLLNDSPVMRFWSSDGSAGMFFGLEANSPEISFTDSEDRNRMKLKLGEAGRPILMMLDETEVPRVSLSIIDDSPRVMLNDRQGTLRIVMCVDDIPHFQIFDTNKTTRVNLSLEPSGPIIAVADEGGTITGLIE